jgi:predicted DNA binding CopG/RHH family protein
MSLLAGRFLMLKKKSKKKKHDPLKSLDKRVTIRLSENDYKALENIAGREGVTSSQIIRTLVKNRVVYDMMKNASRRPPISQ